MYSINIFATHCSFQPPNMDRAGSLPGDGGQLLAELCAERDALLRFGGRDDKEGGEGRDSIDVPCHSLRLLEDGTYTHEKETRESAPIFDYLV